MKKYIFAIILIAAFLRFYAITDLPPGLYPDEAMNGNNALEAISSHDWKVFYPENNGREGLFINIQSLFIYVLGNKPWVLRLPSAIFGTFTVLGLYFFVKELFKNNILALFSSYFLATSFWHINFSRIGFRAITAPFFLVWSFYLLVKAYNENRETDSLSKGNTAIHSAIYAAIAGLAFGLGFNSYIAYRAMPLIAFAVLFIFWRGANKELKNRLIKSSIIFTVFALMAFLPLGIYFLKNPADFMGRTAQVSVFSSPAPFRDLGTNILKTLGMFNFSGDFNWRHNIAARPEIFWPVGLLFLFGCYLSLKKVFWKREWQSPEFIVLAWAVAAALPVVVSNEGIPHALRAILMAPAVFVLAGIGADRVFGRFKNSFQANIWLQLAGFAFVALLFYEAFYSYFVIWGKNPNVAGAFDAGYAEIGKELNSLSKETPKCLIVKADGVLVRGIPMPSQTVMFITDTFTEQKQRDRNIYYIVPGDGSLNVPLGCKFFDLN